MAAFVLTSKTILIGTAWTGTAPGGSATPSGTITSPVDISVSVFQGADVGMNTAMVSTTNFASGGFEQMIPGLRSGDDLQIVMNQDYAASETWADITGVFGSLAISAPGDAVRYIDIKPTSSARSTTNPSYVFGVYAKGVQAIQGSVGDKAQVALTLQITGAFAALTS
jgi:hypothetical protein